MKDTEARNQIRGLREGMDILRERLQPLRGVSVRDCPVCKHPTLQKDYSQPHGASTTTGTFCLTIEGYPTIEGCPAMKGYSSMNGFSSDKLYQCLNCGSKIKCSIEEKCKIVKKT